MVLRGLQNPPSPRIPPAAKLHAIRVAEDRVRVEMVIFAPFALAAAYFATPAPNDHLRTTHDFRRVTAVTKQCIPVHPMLGPIARPEWMRLMEDAVRGKVSVDGFLALAYAAEMPAKMAGCIYEQIVEDA